MCWTPRWGFASGHMFLGGDRRQCSTVSPCRFMVTRLSQLWRDDIIMICRFQLLSESHAKTKDLNKIGCRGGALWRPPQKNFFRGYSLIRRSVLSLPILAFICCCSSILSSGLITVVNFSSCSHDFPYFSYFPYFVPCCPYFTSLLFQTSIFLRVSFSQLSGLCLCDSVPVQVSGNDLYILLYSAQVYAWRSFL